MTITIKSFRLKLYSVKLLCVSKNWHKSQTYSECLVLQTHGVGT